MSKKLIILILLLLPTQLLAKSNFVPGVSDLPVPMNFFLIDDSSTIYHNKAGRIVNASFKGRGKEKNVADFYHKTLPALGWEKIEDLVYIRDTEKLYITIETIKTDSRFNNLNLIFSLKPSSSDL